MSYDLMVFDPAAAPRERDDFLRWYDAQTEWTEGHITLVPIYAQNMLTPNVVARSLDGIPPNVDLVLGYADANQSPVVRDLIARAEDLIESVQNQSLIQYPELAPPE
jgi:hypothetical protein